MQTINKLEYDPLDRPIDFGKARITKCPFKFDFDEKVKVWLDTLYEDCDFSKNDFYDKVNKSLKTFCNIK